MPQEEMQLVDEQVIPTESRCGVKQENRISGTGYDFEIYTGKAPNTQERYLV